MSTFLSIAAGLLAFGVIATFVLSLTASRPDNLGVTDGRLADPPASPNCVSTQTSERSHWIAPLSFEGAPQEAMETLVEVVDKMPGSSIIEHDGNYLYAEFQSVIFRFTDDVEFLVEPESNRIHCRSASRVGRSDLGANRDRIEKVRAAFNAATKQTHAESRSEESQAAVEPVISE